jgi:hypothetical protein
MKTVSYKRWQVPYTITLGVAAVTAGTSGFVWVIKAHADAATALGVSALSAFAGFFGVVALVGVWLVAVRRRSD